MQLIRDEVPGVGPKRKRELLRRFGSLAVRKQADVAALEIKEGDRGVYDVFGGPRKVGRPVMPVPGVRKGQVFEAGWGLRAWGWEPDEA